MDNSKLANPAPLDLMGFGMPTILLAGLICGANAIDLATGEVLNEQPGRTVLPNNKNKNAEPGSAFFMNVEAAALPQHLHDSNLVAAKSPPLIQQAPAP